MSKRLLVRLTKLTEQNQGNVFTYTTKQKENETQALSTEIVFVRLKKNRQIIIKEEGSKEEDRQEEVFVIVKNGYTDLKRHHQNDENQEDF